MTYLWGYAARRLEKAIQCEQAGDVEGAERWLRLAIECEQRALEAEHRGG